MDISLSLKAYFKDLKTVELLNGEEQTELAIKAKSGDKNALDKLVRSNLRFVVKVAKEYQYSNVPLEDLISEGNIGLIKAVDKFDETRKIRFISYAVWWIRQSIIQSIYENESIVRLPVNRININNKISKTKDILFKELNRDPTPKEISDFCNVCEIDITNSLSDCNYSVELENPCSEDSKSTFSDCLEGEEYENIQKDFNRQAASHEINTALSGLNKRESKILKMYFGLETGQEMNLREIGEKLDLTNERVRQIKDFALKKLRTYGKSYKLREFLNCKL
jgi:RNA polymerase primary sigma factor